MKKAKAMKKVKKQVRKKVGGKAQASRKRAVVRKAGGKKAGVAKRRPRPVTPAPTSTPQPSIGLPPTAVPNMADGRV